MIIKEDAWYVRWFRFNCRVMDNFFGGKRTQKLEECASLCQFFRILTLGTMVFLATVSVYVYAFTVFLIMPVVLFSTSSLLIFVGAIAGVICSILGVLWVLFALVPEWIEKNRNRMHDFVHGETHNPGFFRLIANYIVAVKNKFCPTIHFTKDKHHD